LPAKADACLGGPDVTTCLHQNKRPVWTDHSAYGDWLEARALREQCPDCGRLFGQAVSHSKAGPHTPEADLKAAARYLELEQAERSAEALERQRLRDKQNEEWWDWYNAYLRTDLWYERRVRVLKRANYICEGCGINRATAVHHLTYDNVCQEFLWQLVAICQDCHDRVHGHGIYAEEVAS